MKPWLQRVARDTALRGEEPRNPVECEQRAALVAALEDLPETWRDVILARDALNSDPAALFGPYWAALVSTLGVGGYLTSKPTSTGVLRPF